MTGTLGTYCVEPTLVPLTHKGSDRRPILSTGLSMRVFCLAMPMALVNEWPKGQRPSSSREFAGDNLANTCHASPRTYALRFSCTMH